MNPRISNSMSVNQLANVPSDMQTYIPAMYQNGADCYESKGKKTSRIIKSVTSIFNSVLLTAGVAIGGFFGFKWLKSSNLSFMSKPLQKYDFKDIANTTSENIAGNDKQKEQLNQIIEDCKKNKNEDGTIKGCGVLLQGPPRCGKTMSAKVFAKESGLTTFTCKTSSIISTVRGQTEKNVDKMFDQLRKQVKKDGKPVILIMDEIDSFLMKRDNATNEERAMVNAFLRNCDELKKQGIIILGSTNYGDKCDKAATGSGRFDQSISFALPTKEELQTMLNKETEIDEKLPKDDTEKNILTIASFMAEHHMNWADAQNVLNQFVDESGNIKFKEAMSYLIDTCKGNSTVQISSLIQKNPPGTEALAWEDIVGQESVKSELKNLAENIQQKKNLTGDKSGITLFGPGGCGKTTLPYALGNKIGSPVYTLRIGENGVTVDNVKSVIEDIKLEGLKRQNEGKSPLILFIDEADAMFPNRKGADLMHNVSNSLDKTTTMLNAIQNLQKSGVLCIAATNHIENIDGPIKERLIPLEVGYPNQQDVKTIISNKFKNTLNELSLDLDKIVKYFCDSDKSKLSPRVIITLLETALQQYASFGASTFYEKLKGDIQAKVDSINKNPTESGLTQIGKSLDEIKKAIEALKDNGVSAQLAEFAKAINANTKQNGQLVESFNNALSALKATMDNINQIVENNTDLMKSYKELTEGVASSLNAVSGALDGNTNAIRTLNETQDKLKGLLEKINELKGGGASDTKLGDIEDSIIKLGNIFETLVTDIRKKEILKSLDNTPQIIKDLPTFKINLKKIGDRNKLSAISLFCTPQYSNAAPSDYYKSYLTNIIYYAHKGLYHDKMPTFNIKLASDINNINNGDIFEPDSKIPKIQDNINSDTKIQVLKELLVPCKNTTIINTNSSLKCFAILVNNFNWESLISKNIDDAFKKNSLKVTVKDDSNPTPSINYNDDDELVVINNAAIPVIQDAFNAILDIVINAWKGHDIDGDYIPY